MLEYKWRKQVWVLNISEVRHQDDGSAVIVPADAEYAPFTVDADYVRRHSPAAGGYYLVYEDVDKSFSPQEAFENGYTSVFYRKKKHWIRE